MSEFEMRKKLQRAAEALEAIRTFEADPSLDMSLIVQYRLTVKRQAGDALIDIQALIVDKDGQARFIGVN